MTETEYMELTESYGGICEACEAIHLDGCEPDAEGYLCEECGENAVSGIELALIKGVIEITGY